MDSQKQSRAASYAGSRHVDPTEKVVHSVEFSAKVVGVREDMESKLIQTESTCAWACVNVIGP